MTVLWCLPPDVSPAEYPKNSIQFWQWPPWTVSGSATSVPYYQLHTRYQASRTSAQLITDSGISGTLPRCSGTGTTATTSLRPDGVTSPGCPLSPEQHPRWDYFSLLLRGGSLVEFTWPALHRDKGALLLLNNGESPDFTAAFLWFFLSREGRVILWLPCGTHVWVTSVALLTAWEWRGESWLPLVEVSGCTVMTVSQGWKSRPSAWP